MKSLLTMKSKVKSLAMTVKKVGKNFILGIYLKLLLEEAIDCNQLLC